jgi:hypothetical protein
VTNEVQPRDSGLSIAALLALGASRDGRSMIYAAQYEQMNALLGFLTENCCAGAPAVCAPPTGKAATSKRETTENA